MGRAVENRTLDLACSLYQFLNGSLVHTSLTAGPEGNGLTILESGGGNLGVKQSRNPKLPGHRGKMTGGAANIGDDAPDLADPGSECGGCGPGDEYGIRFKLWGGGLKPDRLLQQDPPGHHTTGGAFSALQHKRVIGIFQGNFGASKLPFRGRDQ